MPKSPNSQIEVLSERLRRYDVTAHLSHVPFCYSQFSHGLQRAISDVDKLEFLPQNTVSL